MNFRKSPLAAAIALCGTLPAFAAEPTPAPTEPVANETVLKEVKVTADGEQAHPYKAERASSAKYTAPLLDTPQTINVVTRETIEDQNLLSLREVLSTLPGITFGAGEGGGGYGDSLVLRGFSGNNDIFADGMRDSAQYTRTDPFNLESVEFVNGPNSVYSGAGSVGGSINLVSKTAQLDDFTSIVAGVGTDSYGRLTLDRNQKLDDDAALRLNLMAHQHDVPGRDVEEYDRWGVAPSLALGLGSKTSVVLNLMHQEDTNIPQYGVPFYNGKPLPGVDPSTYFGYRNIDTQEIEVDSFTVAINHQFSDNFSVRNQSRWQHVQQLTIVDPPQGTFCLGNNQTPLGVACPNGQPANTYQPSGPRGSTRDAENYMLANQTDFTSTFSTAGIGHTLVSGFSFAYETFSLVTGNVLRNEGGTTPNPTLPLMYIYAPYNHWDGPINFIPSAKTEGDLSNRALYVFDTMKFNDQWQLNAGVRYERHDGSSQATASIATPAAGGAEVWNPTAKNGEDLVSYRVGVVFKPAENASVYVAYGNSKTPSKASVNGSCTLTSTTGTANCAVEAEDAVNIELGTKWDFYDGKLGFTASLFRNDRTNYRVSDAGNPDNPAQEQQLDGEARVDGLSLSVSGLLRDNWSVNAAYTYLDTEVLQGASDYIASQGRDYTKGDPLLNVPEHALNLWTTYDLPYGIQVGYGITYQGAVTVQQHSATVTGDLSEASSYTVHRAMAAYKLTRDLDLQLNINNLADKEYYTRPRNNGWSVPGDARQIVLSATYSF